MDLSPTFGRAITSAPAVAVAALTLARVWPGSMCLSAASPSAGFGGPELPGGFSIAAFDR